MKIPDTIPVICGPTGSGKTALALKIAQVIPLEIVSADSRQMIRKLNIGTAKPTSEEKNKIPFHLINIIEPGGDYSAFKFIEDADQAISDILSRQKLPVVVGGTGLYLKALSEGIFDVELDNSEIRRKLEQDMKTLGPEVMYQKLKHIDPQEAAKHHPNNLIRTMRALELYHLTGKTKSELIQTAHYRKSQYQFKFFCLVPSREKLYKSLERRVEQMLENGLLNEIKGLINAGLTKPVQEMNVIGYTELIEFLLGNKSLDQAVLLMKQNTRRYAKRQITWFRHQIAGDTFSSPIELKKAFWSHYASFGRRAVKKLDMN